MRKIYLATTNSRKIREAKAAASLFDGVVVEPFEAKVKELQSSSAEEVTAHKAEQAHSIVGKPVVVTDTFWNIPALG